MTDTMLVPDHSPPAAETWTRREILQQPETLHAVQVLIRKREGEIAAFLRPLLANPALRIVLTGAGTSAFVGETLAPWLSRLLGRTVEAIATTDIVSAPALLLGADRPTLLVSFGRSGNSPESGAALDVAEARLSDVRHLMITCNPDSELARRAGPRGLAIVLPDETHDRGYAMTSSFTGMMLAALSIFSGPATLDDRLDAIADSVASALESETQVAALAARGFDRVVYLGSGLFKALSREAALKLLELTDGGVVTLADTSMGFRHGPKTVLTGSTLVVVFVSNDPLTRRYDLDLIEELRTEGRSGAVLAIGTGDLPEPAIRIGHLDDAGDADLLFAFIVPAQLFALHASIALGFAPDLPNTSGVVSRVVTGVRIHEARA